MGFLSGAYGKLMAGKMVRQLQYQATMVQSRLRRVTKEIANQEKLFSAQERQLKADMQRQMQSSIFGQANLYGIDMSNPLSFLELSKSEKGSAYLQAFNQFQQYQQAQFVQAQSAWQNAFEMMRDSVLEQLKDEEDDLQTEKDNLDSRIKIAQQEYEAKKEEEKAGVKGLAPEYTGQ